MPEQIQNIPLGLLAAAAGPPTPGTMPLLGLLPAAAAGRRPAPPAPEPAGQRPFAGLFNTGSQPSGYTPQDVQKVIQDRASYYQNFPIVPMWNGGRGAGGILPGIANFGAGFMGSSLQGRQEQNARENERIRREASSAASNATDLEAAVRALQSGTPEQSNVAMQYRLQQLVKDRERERQAAIMAQVYGAQPAAAATPSETAAPAAPPSAPAPAAPAAPVEAAPAPAPQARQGDQFDAQTMMDADWRQYLDMPARPPVSSSVPAAVPTAPPRVPVGGYSIGLPPEMQSAAAPSPQPPSAPAAQPPSTPGQPAAPVAAPQVAPALPAQSDPPVQIGPYTFPLSEARRRAALGRAQGIDVKPIEDAIQLAEEPLKAQARERGKALGEAQNSLPQAIQAAQSTIGKIDEISSDPQLQRIVGFSPYNPVGYLPNSPAQRGLVERIKQVQGRFFLQAFDALRGTGQISNAEGEKAQAAIARIQDIHQDWNSYLTALEDARREVWSLTNTARQRAGLAPVPYQPAPPAVGAVREGYRFNGGDPANPASWTKVR